jgi:hypothetical protein
MEEFASKRKHRMRLYNIYLDFSNKIQLLVIIIHEE